MRRSAAIGRAASCSCSCSFSFGSRPASSVGELPGEYQNLWGQAAMATSIRGATRRLHDQKLRRLACPHKSAPHTFWYSLYGREPTTEFDERLRAAFSATDSGEPAE